MCEYARLRLSACVCVSMHDCVCYLSSMAHVHVGTHRMEGSGTTGQQVCAVMGLQQAHKVGTLRLRETHTHGGSINHDTQSNSNCHPVCEGWTRGVSAEQSDFLTKSIGSTCFHAVAKNKNMRG